jgi:glycosyltransferase involved in cell wall biosynthesis
MVDRIDFVSKGIWSIPVGILSILEFVQAIIRSWSIRRSCTVYLSARAGRGLVFEAAHAWLAVVFGVRRILVHHHARSYVDDPTWLRRWVYVTTGQHVEHVVLCSVMRDLFQDRFPRSTVISMVDNAAFVEPAPILGPTDSAISIGHISSLNVEKGVDEFLRLVELAADRHPGRCRFVLAGPDSDYIRRALNRVDPKGCQVNFVGHISHESVSDFYSQIDYLYFPSRYRNEVAPLVVYEAAAHGVVPIATHLGCMPEQLCHIEGVLASGNAESDVSLIGDLATIRQGREAARRRYQDWHSESLDSFIRWVDS